MLKLFKGLDQPPTIINTDHIKFVQHTKIGYCMRLFMNEGFAESYRSYEGGIILQVDYHGKNYNSDLEVIEDFLNFLSGPDTTTDKFGIYKIEA